MLRMDQSNKVEDLAAEISESDLPSRTEYEWETSHMTHQFLKYRRSSMVESYAASVTILFDSMVKGELTLERCIVINNVCHGRVDNNTNFFFYVCVSFYRFSCLHAF